MILHHRTSRTPLPNKISIYPYQSQLASKRSRDTAREVILMENKITRKFSNVRVPEANFKPLSYTPTTIPFYPLLIPFPPLSLTKI